MDIDSSGFKGTIIFSYLVLWKLALWRYGIVLYLEVTPICVIDHPDLHDLDFIYFSNSILETSNVPFLSFRHRVGHPHSWQGPSSINVWREFDDDFGSPQQQRTSLVKTQPSSLTTISLPNRCAELLHNQYQDAGIKNKVKWTIKVNYRVITEKVLVNVSVYSSCKYFCKCMWYEGGGGGEYFKGLKLLKLPFGGQIETKSFSRISSLYSS